MQPGQHLNSGTWEAVAGCSKTSSMREREGDTWIGRALLSMAAAAALAPTNIAGSSAGCQSGVLSLVFSCDWSHQIFRAPVRACRACIHTQHIIITMYRFVQVQPMLSSHKVCPNLF